MEGFFRDYFAYVGNSEVPDIFHRWTALSVAAALLGRQAWFEFGPNNIYPNLLILLQGPAAARKSTAIKIGTRLLQRTGYTRFASERMSRQTFLDEMHRINQPETMGVPLEEQFDMDLDYPNEMTIHALEFIDFIGQNDKDYLALLTTLYDNLPQYANPKMSSKSVVVRKPTINLLGAATPENLNMAFPPNAMDTGTFSRILFVYADKVQRRMLIPDQLDKEAEKRLVDRLTTMQREVKGAMTLSGDARIILDHIYQSFTDLPDPRFNHYGGRRLTHLIKLSMLYAALRLSKEIDVEDILLANTTLSIAEHYMPKALGHFGRSRQSAIAHNMLEHLAKAPTPVGVPELYRAFMTDFTSEKEFSSVLFELQTAQKIRLKEIPGTDKVGFVVIERPMDEWLKPLIEQTAAYFTEAELKDLYWRTKK